MKSNNTLTFLLVLAGFVVVLYLAHNWNHPSPVANSGEVAVGDIDVTYGSAAQEDMHVVDSDPRQSESVPAPATEGDLTGAGVQDDMNVADNREAQRLRQASCFPKEQLLPEELLPQDNSSMWAQVNPQGMGSLKDKSFLQAGHNIGINTVGQTLRNANLQLRSEPPNPQVVVSPWVNSSIQPDTNRRPFEIGSC
jgi:hypothetical protein